MRKVYVMVKKELTIIFASPIAWVIMALFFTISTYFFITSFQRYNMLLIQAQRSPGLANMLNVNTLILSPTWGAITILLIIMMPFITMRLIAEEKRQNTLELLLTSPVGLFQVVLGKFLACFIFFAVMMLLTTIYPLLLTVISEPDWGPILSAYLGFLLLGGTFIAFGLLFSSLTENQVIAAALTVSFLLITWFMSMLSTMSRDFLVWVLAYMSPQVHINSFFQGVIDTSHLVYFVSAILLGLFFAYQVLESRRWR